MIEYGILWTEEGSDGAVEPCASQEEADRIVSMYSWNGYVVSRTVTYGEWTERTLAESRARCGVTRWPEQHPDDCAWCAHLAGQKTRVTSPGVGPPP
jgi:hypothetical protein